MDNTEEWICPRVGEAEVESPHAEGNFVRDEERVLLNNVLYGEDDQEHSPRILLERAGLRRKIHYNPVETKVGIVTCGGLCPGLNAVIRGLVIGFWHGYGVHNIVGYQYGFEGLNRELSKSIALTPAVVKHIHKRGGTILGTSRGPQKVEDMVAFLLEEKVNILLCIGGDGTLRGAAAIAEVAKNRISVLGVPKTIDNDIAVITKSFGFDTACEEAQRVIDAGNSEALSHQNGIAIIKLMGRDSGFIALYAALSSGEVNTVLIPEACVISDELVRWTRTRLETRGHSVIVVAEGACQEMLSEYGTTADASGNKKSNMDVGPFLKALLEEKLKDLNPTIKYIDPSYTIRACAGNAGDLVFCQTIAQMTVHAAMSGVTAACVGEAAGRMVILPLERIAYQPRKKVDIRSSIYQTLIDSTGMPRSIFKK